MDLFQIIYIGSFQLVFFAFLMLIKRHKTQADWWLMSFFLVIFSFLQCIIHSVNATLPNIQYVFLEMPFGFLMIPIFYAYIESHNKPITWKYILHFIPAVLSLFILLFTYILLPFEEQKAMFLDVEANGMPIWPDLVQCFTLLYLHCHYIFLSWKSLKKHEEYTLMRFSYTENLSLSWLNRIIWIFIIVTANIGIVLVIYVTIGHVQAEQFIWVPISLLMLGMLYLGAYGIQSNVAFSELGWEPKGETTKPQTIEATHHENATETDSKFEIYHDLLLKCMTEKKPYLNAKLSLKELATLADIPYYHLSTLLNQHLQISFYDFINQYRVEEFIVLKQDPKNEQFTLLSLAYEAGFNSKSTFYSIFKKSKGASPTEFFKSNLSQVFS